MREINMTMSRPTEVAESAEPCPVETAIDLIGGKWKVLILWHLQEHGTLRFAQLRRAIGDVSQKVLSQQLRELERMACSTVACFRRSRHASSIRSRHSAERWQVRWPRFANGVSS